MFDVIILGGGPVGAALAVALSGTGRRIALIEERAPQLPEADRWDSRVFAVSPGSQLFLDRLGAWPRLATERVTPVRRMEVSGDAGGRLAFDYWDAGRSELGWIVENARLQQALWQVIADTADVVCFCPASVTAIDRTDAAAVVTLADGRRLEGHLLVGADGGQSRVRAAAGFATAVRPYGQHGVVAHFAVAQAHRHVARQWFAGGEVLALLPLPGRQVSMVWSVADDRAHHLTHLPAEALTEAVAAAAGQVLGRMELCCGPLAFPLQLVKVRPLTGPRIALVGDAAHGVHPLAGQGVNLGFQDARVLAEVLRRHDGDCGDVTVLSRYERQRKEAILAMQGLTDGLHRLFSLNLPGVAVMRNTGMSMVGRLHGLRRMLVRHAIA